MAKKFNGKIELDIRDSTPDWGPFLAPEASDGAPNVLLLAWDDVGYGTMDVFGGPVQTPAHRGNGCAVCELPHDRVVLADALVTTDGS